MQTTTEFTAGPDSYRAERFVNDAVAEGKTVTVNGVEVWSRWGSPAASWQNGSFSWKSRARTVKGGTRDNWVKAGGTVRVTVEG